MTVDFRAVLWLYPDTGLKSGDYTADVTITADGGFTFSFQVNFTVNAITCLTVTPEALDFGTVDENYTQPAAKAKAPVTAASYFQDAVDWAVSTGITVGTNDGSTFSPNNTCGRGEIVIFLHRAYVPSARLK